MLFWACSLFASVDVKFRDGYLLFPNQANVVIKLTNNTLGTINNPSCFYYFSTDQNKIPRLEDWWSPGCSPSLEQIGQNLWRIKFVFNCSILPNQTFPNNDEISVGLHYHDWSDYNKSDDPSYLAVSEFTINKKIPVYNDSGALVGGEEPSYSEFIPTLSTNAIKVFFKEGAPSSANSSTVKFFIQNDSTASINNFYCYYYFRVENNKTPVITPYYIPNCNVSLQHVNGNIYRIKYNFYGFTLQSGAKTPGADGNSFGIRYSDWSPLNKTNDLSNALSEVFVPTKYIPVYSQSGKCISGLDLSKLTNDEFGDAFQFDAVCKANQFNGDFLDTAHTSYDFIITLDELHALASPCSSSYFQVFQKFSDSVFSLNDTGYYSELYQMFTSAQNYDFFTSLKNYAKEPGRTVKGNGLNEKELGVITKYACLPMCAGWALVIACGLAADGASSETNIRYIDYFSGILSSGEPYTVDHTISNACRHGEGNLELAEQVCEYGFRGSWSVWAVTSFVRDMFYAHEEGGPSFNTKESKMDQHNNTVAQNMFYGSIAYHPSFWPWKRCAILLGFNVWKDEIYQRSWRAFKFNQDDPIWPEAIANNLMSQGLMVYYAYPVGYPWKTSNNGTEPTWVRRYMDNEPTPFRVYVTLKVVDQNFQEWNIAKLITGDETAVYECNTDVPIGCLSYAKIPHETKPAVFYICNFKEWVYRESDGFGDQAMIYRRNANNTNIVNLPRRDITLYAQYDIHLIKEE